MPQRPSTWEADARRSRVQGQPETLSQKNKQTRQGTVTHVSNPSYSRGGNFFFLFISIVIVAQGDTYICVYNIS
jgi:hypothetical protein